MKNLIYYPFSRNRYFNGKLLTAQDFEQEQRYMNDKRRLINRWILGSGVAAGLEVVQIDDYSVSLEMGLAFDQSGREIFVEAPVILKLSLLDGYEEATKEEGNESLYLCIEYSQTETEPVHNINNDAVHVGGQMENSKYSEGFHIYVTDDEPEQEAEEDTDEKICIAKSAEKISRGTYRRGIYLAKIMLVKAGDFYMIDRVIRQPFEQYVYNLPLINQSLRRLKKNQDERNILKAQSLKTEEKDLPVKASPFSGWQFSEGHITIAVPEDTKEGMVLFSRECPHNLGPGDTSVFLHLTDGAFSFGGSPGIFLECTIKAETAVKLNRNDGTFVVGARLLSRTDEKEITVGWTAVRNRTRNEFTEGDARIFINPSMMSMKAREETVFSVICVNMEDKSVTWKVVQPEGGSVDENGRYHAPGTAGVYEIEAKSTCYPGVKTSVFVIVRAEA